MKSCWAALGTRIFPLFANLNSTTAAPPTRQSRFSRSRKNAHQCYTIIFHSPIHSLGEVLCEWINQREPARGFPHNSWPPRFLSSPITKTYAQFIRHVPWRATNSSNAIFVNGPVLRADDRAAGRGLPGFFRPSDRAQAASKMPSRRNFPSDRQDRDQSKSGERRAPQRLGSLYRQASGCRNSRT